MWKEFRTGTAGILGLILASGCVPLELSKNDVLGKWRVEWKCGVEKLELKEDGSYVQEIEFAGGGRASHSGTAWRVLPMESRIDPGHVELVDALQFCSVFGEKLPKAETGNLKLATIWEWGRTVLSFNPDIQGFVRK